METQEKKSRWKLIAGIILIVQLIVSIVLIGVVFWLDLLPAVYVLLIGLLLLLLLCLVYILFYAGMRFGKRKKKEAKKKKTRLYIKRSAGCVLSALTMCFCVVASSMLVQAGNTINRVSDQTIVTDTTAVYVLEDDPAQTIEDAADYLFAVTETLDAENTQKAVEEISEQVGKDITTQAFQSVFDMVDALYDGTVDAMILNVAYVDLIEAEDDYDTFSSKTRSLFDHEVETVVSDRATTENITEEPFVIYISGSDTRTTGLNSNTRSDVNILAVVNPATKQILLINTPRDYYVDISVSEGSKDKLTHCGVYGIDCSMDSLGNLYDEEINYYAKINFNGFITLIDAIGGITIESEKTFTTYTEGYTIYEGVNELNGAQALEYVRERKAFADGDNARGRHQMQMIEAIIDKVSSGTTILSNYSEILSSMEGMFTTNMTSDEISSLVKMQLTDGASWNVLSFAVSGTGSKQYVYSIPGKRTYVTIPDETSVSYAKLLIDKTMDGVILTEDDMTQPTYESTESE